MTNYIPLGIWKSTFTNPQMMKSFTLVEKVPVSKIKIDKSLFSWQNEVSDSQVDFICENFDIDFWMPITVNPDYFLLDGQHRLRVAKKMGLKYIDLIIDNESNHAKN